MRHCGQWPGPRALDGLSLHLRLLYGCEMVLKLLFLTSRAHRERLLL
jgi:hypothetical protein